MSSVYEVAFGHETLSIETGKLAEQANGSVVVRYGDVMMLVTVCAAQSAREGVDFLPLTVDLEERLYAAGRIPGSFFRREGRPGPDAIIASRLIDRPLRPLFPKGLRNEVQILVTMLSVDHINPPETLSLIGASAALTISDIPFNGIVGACRIGYVNGEYVVNPTYEQLDQSSLNLMVAGTTDAVMMIESESSDDIDEEMILEGVQLAQKYIQEVVQIQESMKAQIGMEKFEFQSALDVDEALVEQVAGLADNKLEEIIDAGQAKGERNSELSRLEKSIKDQLGDETNGADLAVAFDKRLKKVIRERILEHGRRPDGRGLKEIRPITSDINVLPRAHGSGLFKRGQTQVLTVCTLGSLSMVQKLDTLSPNDTKRYIHHYNFPPYSTGEVKRVGTGRREIGHGALAERALVSVIPDEDEFPYTIRLVSECLSSNGSTSMASTCGSTLAMMNAGVPIKKPVSGIAMGLIKGDGDNFVVLSDIQGIEDFMGDMDFKVTGTRDGVTAVQLDIKVGGITTDIMRQALAQAKEGRLFIMDEMLKGIGDGNAEVSKYAPKFFRTKVPVDKIGGIIGPGGKNIRFLQERFSVSINVDDDGTVTVGSNDEADAQAALDHVNGMVEEAVIGKIYDGKVTRIMTFGAFVEILPGKEGLVHISEIAVTRIGAVEDELSEGDEVTVMVADIDNLGRINLSRRVVLEDGTLDDVKARSSTVQRNRDSRGPRSGGRPNRY